MQPPAWFESFLRTGRLSYIILRNREFKAVLTHKHLYAKQLFHQLIIFFFKLDRSLRAAEIGYEAGLRFVDAGNLPGCVKNYENTYCPNCHKLLIELYG